VLFVSGAPEWLRVWRGKLDFEWWPWMSTARVATDRFHAADLAAILAWTAGAAVFGWWQFQRGFAVDADEARATPAEASRFAAWTDRLYSLPSALLPDPLGGLVEKEIRFLSRAPRFRIVFLMGFSFGLLIWLPLAFRGGQESDGFFAQNYLTIVSAYALMLLGEVSFWNVFGFDRGAVLNYFVLPVRFSRVLIAKNITAAVFVFLEIGAIASVCFLLRMPVTLAKLAECYAVTAVMTLLLLAVGNLGSVYYPRAGEPGSFVALGRGRPVSSVPDAAVSDGVDSGGPCLPGALRLPSRNGLSWVCSPWEPGSGRLSMRWRSTRRSKRRRRDASSVDGAQRRRGPAYRLAICGAGNFARGRAFSAPKSRLKSGCGQYWPPYASEFPGLPEVAREILVGLLISSDPLLRLVPVQLAAGAIRDIRQQPRLRELVPITHVAGGLEIP
jgi:hypothetical protein